MYKLIDNSKLQSAAKNIVSMPEIENCDAFVGLGYTGEAVASGVSLSKGKPCITYELIERIGDGMVDINIRLIIIFSDEIKCEQLLESIKKYRALGFLISTVVSLDEVCALTEKELRMLGVKVMGESELLAKI